MGLSLKSVGRGLQKVAKFAAPVVGAINPIAGIALGAASGLGHGGNSLKQMAGGAAGGAIGALGGGALKSVGGGLGGALGKAGGFALDNPELILGAASALQGAHEQSQANAMQKRALALAEQPWNETAGLRSQAISKLQNPEQTNLGAIFGGGSNPFAPRKSGFGSFSR